MKCDEIEVYLSGFLDNELPQQQRQMVQAHLETCKRCRGELEQLREMQRRAGQIELSLPGKRDWERMEKRIFQSISRGLGWVILIVWSIVTFGYASFQFATAPGEPLFEKILVFGFFLGLGLLFLSVLSERMRESRTDRYKGVLR